MSLTMKRFGRNCLCFLLAFSVILGLAPVRMAEAATAGFWTEPMVSLGSQHTAALKSDGTVWACA